MRLDTDMALASHHATLHFWTWCALGNLRSAANALGNPAFEPRALAAIAETCRLLDEIEAASEKNGCPLRGPREATSARSSADMTEPHCIQWTAIAVEGLEAVAGKADGPALEVQARAALHESRRLLAEMEQEADRLI